MNTHTMNTHTTDTHTTDTHTTDTARLIKAVTRLYMEASIEVLERFERLYPEDAKFLEDLIIN